MNIAIEHFSEETMQRFQHELNKYPDDQKQSAVIACLSILQQENGFVTPEQEKALAAVLEMPVQPATGWTIQNQCVYQFALPVTRRSKGLGTPV